MLLVRKLRSPTPIKGQYNPSPFVFSYLCFNFLHTYTLMHLKALVLMFGSVFVFFSFFTFITSLYILNNIEEGGQTAFLKADNATNTLKVINLSELMTRTELGNFLPISG